MGLATSVQFRTGKWRSLVQYAGRLHHPAKGKTKVLIFDYLDAMLPLTMKMYLHPLARIAGIGFGTGLVGTGPDLLKRQIIIGKA
jgi:hypothetical protein